MSVDKAVGKGFEYRGSLKNEAGYRKLSNESLLNPNNEILDLERGHNLTSFNLSCDADWKNKIRGHLNLHAFYDTQEGGSIKDVKVNMNELFFNFFLGERLELDLGKEIIRWGTGYAWNPTGLISPLKDCRDPTDRLEMSKGLEMVKLNLFLGGVTITGVALPELDFPREQAYLPRWKRTDWAGKIYKLVKDVDLSLVAFGGGESKTVLGMSFSRVLGNNLELHGEIAGKQGSENFYLEKKSEEYAVSGTLFPRIYEYSKSRIDEKKIYSQYVLGSQYTFQNGINLALEYFHNGEGYNNEEWSDIIEFLRYSNQALNDDRYTLENGENAGKIYLVGANGYLNSLTGVRRNYLFLRGYIPSVFRHSDLEIILVNSLDDGSFVIIPTLSYEPLGYLSFYLLTNIFLGDGESEFGILYENYTVDLGVNLFF
jgi:hypothetical protein